VKQLREDFPIFCQEVNGYPLVYLDSAATSQKPQAVIDSVVDFYTKYNSNIHRSVHAFSEQATGMFEEVRQKVAEFIGAADPCEIIFTKGTTEGLNFVAATWGQKYVEPGDEIVMTAMEHHANLLPWQQVAQKKGAKLTFIPITKDGLLDLSNLSDIITKKTKVVAVIHASNVLGTHVDVATIAKAAHVVGAKVVVDAAQTSPHQKLDVQKLDCDFLAFSGHKMLGPTGVGVLYIKKELQDLVPPYQFGGGMVFEACYEKSTWQFPPYKFEAGTPAIAQVIGLGVAIDYYNKNIDFDAARKHEAALTTQAIDGLQKMEDVRILGPIEQLKTSGHLVTFVVDGIHSHDVAAYLSNFGVCTRAGHHCAQPLAKKLGVMSSVRASFMFYNTPQEVETFLKVLQEIKL